MRVLRDTGWKPFISLASGVKGGITGGVLAFNPSTPIPVLSRYFSSTYVVFGPVLAREKGPAALAVILDSLESKARQSNSILGNVKVPFGASNEETFKRHGFVHLSPLAALY